DNLLKSFVIRRTAVRISRAVRLDRPNKDRLRPQHLRPAHCRGEKMGVAKGNIRHGDRLPNHPVLSGLRNCDARIRERRAANAAEQVSIEVQEVLKAQLLGNRPRRLQFPLLGALAIAEVQRVGVKVAYGKRGANSRIHPSGEADDGTRSGIGHTGYFTGREMSLYNPPLSITTTPSRANSASIARTEPFTSMARQASRITTASNPHRRASTAEKPTQKSYASPAKNI